MIGKKVITIPHNELSDNYYNLEGVVVNYQEEPEIKRSVEHNNNPMPTGRIVRMYQVEFTDHLPHREMCKKLWLLRDMFNGV